jgi:hypothetical protein
VDLLNHGKNDGFNGHILCFADTVYFRNPDQFPVNINCWRKFLISLIPDFPVKPTFNVFGFA